MLNSGCLLAAQPPYPDFHATVNTTAQRYATLPAPATVNIENTNLSIQFVSSSTGFWCSGSSCFGDFGTTSTWTLVSTPTGIPAVMDWELAALAAALAVLGARLAGPGFELCSS